MKFFCVVATVFGLSCGFLQAGPPVITNPPASQIILEGQPAWFTVGAVGSTPLSYQWQRNGTPIPAATNAGYTLLSVSQADHNEVFSVVVSNAFGVTVSAEALLRVDPGIVSTQSVRLLTISNLWRYNSSNVNLGTSWVAPAYPDSTWLQGRAPFDGKMPTPRSTLPNGEPVRTQLAITNSSGSNITTFYFRAHFTNTVTNAFAVTLQPTFLVDDGVAAYVNGTNLYRLGVVTNATFTNWASRVVDAAFEGPFDVAWPPLPAGANVVAAEVHQGNATSSDLTFGMILDATYAVRSAETNPPTILNASPAAGTTLNSLSWAEVAFTEAVEGVDAADLLVNGVPAAAVTALSPSQYRWGFPSAANGVVAFSWASNHGIHDASSRLNPLVAAGWSVTVDPNLAPVRVWISECMASNKKTLRDENGDYSDWIELYNDETSAVSVQGWSLTDTTNNIAKWRFPAISIPARGYLLVFASGKDRTNPIAPLHTNFNLDKDGEYLGLALPSGQVVSEFRPVLPGMEDDISFGRDPLVAGNTGYYTTPTPGAANATSGLGFGPDVRFSVDSRTFSNAFSLSLSTPDAPGATIRYVILTNAFLSASINVPTTNSPVYSGPLTVDRTMMVRARAFLPGTNYFPGAPHTEHYVQLGPNTAAFDSDLPVVVIHTLSSATIPGGDPDQGVIFAVFEPRFGVTRLTDTPALVSRAGVNIRGSTSAGFPKTPFAVELQDEFGLDTSREVLGMPKESDWVLYPADCFDLSLMNNSLMNAISRGLGRYAPRTRFVELMVNNVGTPLALGANYSAAASPQYRGIYVLMEKIKRDSGRVDIDQLQPEHTNSPAITGGYLLKVDRVDSDEVSFKPAGFESGNYQTMIYQDPKGPEIATLQRAAQTNYIRTNLSALYQSLTNANWLNRTSGWAPYVNWESAIDHHLINLACFNVDALRLSAFFYKPRNKPLEFGPVWDCDRGLGSSRNDTRPFNPRRWIGAAAQTGGDGGTDYFNSDWKFPNPWYSRMCKDPDFWQAWIDRYQALRRGALHTNTIFAAVTNFANQVRRAHPREVARWGGNGSSDTRPRSGTVSADGYSHTFDGTYEGELVFLKKWLTDRLNFMDTNFLAAPALNSGGGPITNTFSLILTDSSGKAGTQLYYTLNGTDPRAPLGAVAPGAQLYSGPVSINANARVVARARNPQHANLTGLYGNPPVSSIWSGPVEATFVSATPPLRITEIMFNPAPPPLGNTNDADNFEFIELRNIGAAALNLNGFRLSGGIDFIFPNLALGAGQACVVVADAAAFQSRYGPGTLLAGQYTNRLGNDSDHLVLDGPLREPILDFHFNDRWHPATDGLGFSLTIVNADAPTNSWSLKSSWRPSGVLGGSPGTNETFAPGIPPVVISEILTHTDLPQVDAIELFNPTATNVILGGWLLTDDFDVPAKFRIPAGTTIAGGKYRTFYGTNGLGGFGAGTNAFVLSSLGDSIWLFSGDAPGNLTGYATGGGYGPQQNGVTFGRHVNSIGEVDWVTEITPTLDAPNAGAKVGPVIISEFSFHPPDIFFGWQTFDNLRDEFVQIENLSAQPVALFDPLAPTNTWRLRGTVDFDFPTNTTLPGNAVFVVVGFEPLLEPAARAAFLAAYPSATNATLLGPWSGKLDNDHGSIELDRPDDPELDGSVPRILVEKIAYRDDGAWPTNADGTGLSLHRTPLESFGNDPASWSAGEPTPGVAFATNPDSDSDGMPDAWELAHGLQVGVNDASLDPDGDGLFNAQEYLARTDPQNPSSALRLTAIPGGIGVFSFEAMADIGYTVEAADSLWPANWATWQLVGVANTNRVIRFTNDSPSETRFFRVVTPSQP